MTANGEAGLPIPVRATTLSRRLPNGSNTCIRRAHKRSGRLMSTSSFVTKLTCFVITLATLATSAAAASATTERAGARTPANKPAVPQLDWTDCDDGFECATAIVPLDYDEPAGSTIKLKL